MDFEKKGALEGNLDIGLKIISTGKTVLRRWTNFKDEIKEVMSARKQGLVDSVVVWTFDTDYRLKYMMGLGVDGIMTNYPDVLYNLWLSNL